MNSRPDSLRRYAIRRVNPFLGVVQVIESAAGRATITNGVTWLMEPLVAGIDDTWGSLNRSNVRDVYVSYGLWSDQEGLVKLRSAFRVDGPDVRHKARMLIQCVQDHLGELPFSLEDRHEYWLFERDNSRPIALLASAIPGDTLPSPLPKYWAAGIGPDGTPGQHRYPGAGELEGLVRDRAGFNASRSWILRRGDGSGVSQASEEPLSAESFPPFLFTEEWPEADQARLAKAFIEWTAPALLTLQHLRSGERERLEKNLRLQSQSVEHHWRLYPEIIDENRINTARVQCRLQRVDRENGSPS